MVILALDSSSSGGSTALLRDGRLAGARVGDPSRTYGEQLPTEFKALLEQHETALQDVDLFAVSIGPGSFTGLRVGIAAIQGLALANDKKVVPVSTFDALAWPLRDAGPVAAWIDARRGEVFAALYDQHGRPVRSPSSMTPLATLDLWASELVSLPALSFVGDGAVRYRADIEQRLESRAVILGEPPPLAPVIAEIAAADPSQAVRPHAVVPLYVRRPDAELARDRAARS
jgi:tRNA threonylcarbamoyladenosine biosynthesis protein TsaB